MHTPIKKLAALAGLSLLLLVPASAVTLTINDGNGGAPGGMVGSITPGTPANAANEVDFVNTLLGMGANQIQVIAPNTFDTTAHDFAGSVSLVGALDFPDNPPGAVPAGFQFVLGKFGNSSFVWYLGGQSFEIAGLGTGLGLSHWLALNPVGTSVPDGGMTAVLLGFALLSMGIIARRKRS